MCTVNTDCLLNLQKINYRTRNSEYNPAKFCGVVMRLREPKATALIFSSGKIVVTGTKHESSALLATRKFVRIIQKLGFQVSLSLRYGITSHHSDSIWQPEMIIGGSKLAG